MYLGCSDVGGVGIVGGVGGGLGPGYGVGVLCMCVL